MRQLFYLIILVTAMGACRKASSPEGPLQGTWVEKNRREDTLVVYRSGRKEMMFDNSKVYRDHRGQWLTDDAFRHEYQLRTNDIGFRFDGSSEFYYYSFRWIRTGEEFTMSYNGFRPYLSSIGEITYERVH